MLTREDILARAKPRTRQVEVESLGGTVTLRAITANERDQLEMFIQKQRGNLRGVRARMVRLCCCKEDGSPLFQEGDETAIGELDGSVLEPLIAHCMELCGVKSQEVNGEKA